MGELVQVRFDSFFIRERSIKNRCTRVSHSRSSYKQYVRKHTGEHSVGTGKRGWLLLEHGDSAMRAMRSIKTALDPAGIMNPGKIFLDEEDV